MDKELEGKLKKVVKLIPLLPIIILSLVSLNLILTILIFLTVGNVPPGVRPKSGAGDGLLVRVY